MAYSTLSYLKTLLAESILLQLSDDTNAGVFVVSPPNLAYTNVVSAIDEADVLIDSYLCGRYEVPVGAPIPNIVRQISGHFALCNLYDRRRELDIPAGIKDRRDRFMRILQDIKAEKADIPELSKKTPSICNVDKTDEDITFSDDLLDRF